ncbi:MAG: glucosidase [Acidobacteriales bacterium]|nr:glucosidase [Terriglobales bacterium]
MDLTKVQETKESQRLRESSDRISHWKRWGPYVAERAWGTVREDYSANGTAWDYFPHDHARSRAYRWNEDGLAGICDRHQHICFALALWNGKDPILKERLFGLTGSEGNHGEDVKEYYFYLDSTPTHSYMKYLYKYPQAAFPYAELLEENRRRAKNEGEYELIDTGVFADNRYFDVLVEYAKAAAEDILIEITVANRGPEEAYLDLLPTIWFRNTWSWDHAAPRPSLRKAEGQSGLRDFIELNDLYYGERYLYSQERCQFLFTENETNAERLFGGKNAQPYVKDAFHEFIIHGKTDAVNPERKGTKAAARFSMTLKPGEERKFRLRFTNELWSDDDKDPLGKDFSAVFAARKAEADEFYATVIPATLTADGKNVMRQALAGMLWSKQYYHYEAERWLEGDPAQPAPPKGRDQGRNSDWPHMYNADVLSMPDKWEYPWFAAWDLAFHCISLALVDSDFAKEQLMLMVREWYMHPNGQIPAYEWAFGDVNPPVHAWASLRVYQIEKKRFGKGDRAFLEKVFHKLMLNFTWWVNRKDTEGNNIFEGGFLGLDNIGVFDRSRPLPTGGFIEQSDGTSWMAMYCLNLLAIALELASENPAYEDVASKFWEHFLYIADAMNHRGADGTSLWDEEDGFFYDVLHLTDGHHIPLKVRSMVGLIPLYAVETLDNALLDRLPGFKRRMEWFIKNRPELTKNIACMKTQGARERRLMSIVNPDQLRRVLKIMLDENEFLSPYGIRAISRRHKDDPYRFQVHGEEFRVDYEPGESSTGLFGGNSNWRGPIWMPVNYLLIESLQRFDYYLGPDFRVECPTGSGNMMTLWEVAKELSQRLSMLFLRDRGGRRPVNGDHTLLQNDPHWQDLVLFYEYFHGDTGRGVGASHQTGWTGVVAKLLQQSGDPYAVIEAELESISKAPAKAETAKDLKKKSARRPATAGRKS